MTRKDFFIVGFVGGLLGLVLPKRSEPSEPRARHYSFVLSGREFDYDLLGRQIHKAPTDGEPLPDYCIVTGISFSTGEDGKHPYLVIEAIRFDELPSWAK